MQDTKHTPDFETIVADIERDFPDKRWLVRLVGRDEDMRVPQDGLNYFAHICGRDIHTNPKAFSIKCIGATATSALKDAYDAALLLTAN
jgi:hypothetical protein